MKAHIFCSIFVSIRLKHAKNSLRSAAARCLCMLGYFFSVELLF